MVESETSRVLDVDGVERVEFVGDGSRVEVIYDSQEFFRDWPHGDDVGTHEQQEEYFQEKFGISWSLVEIDFGSTRGGDGSQVAIFER